MKKVEEYYPITVISYPLEEGETEHHTQRVILTRHIEDYTPPIKRSSLASFMNGQTATMDGLYPEDVERWLNGQENTD